MKIVGCDLHARQQTIAMVDTEDRRVHREDPCPRRECSTSVLRSPGRSGGGGHRSHRSDAVVLGAAGRAGNRMPGRTSGQDPSGRNPEAEARSTGCRVDTGNCSWKDRFPEIWMPSTEQRDLRTLLRDRHQWVKMRARLQHTLQAIALNHALRQGRALWSAAGQSALQALPLPPYTDQRRTSTTEVVRTIAETNPGTGSRSGSPSRTKAAGAPAANPSGRGTSDGLGHRGVSRRPESLCHWQPGGQLHRDDSV